MRRLGWWLYQVAMAGALVLAAPVLLARRGRHYLPTLSGRLGRAPAGGARARPGGLWLHAVSVGEVGVAATLARALPPGEPALVTTVTPTGQARARAAFADAAVAYLPFDVGFAVRRFFRRHRPGALVLVEGDYWPLVLEAARRRQLPVAVVNGRVGDASYRRMRRLRHWLGPLFSGVTRFGVQTAGDRDRLLALGVPAERVTVTGNLKYETPEPAAAPELATAVERLADGRPLLVAGSTMAGEDAAVLDAFTAAGGGRRALLVLAPRHPERWDEVATLATESGFAVRRRSELDDAAPDERSDLLLLDTIGELAGLYRMARAAFVGGTLVPTGGHNPLEAARFGVPVAVGPSMENFRQMAADFDEAGAWRRVAGADELGRVWARWLDDPEAARADGAAGRALIEAHRGALRATRRLLDELLAGLADPIRAGRAR